MKIPQVVNVNTDSVLAFDGENVINNTDQLPLYSGHSISSVAVDVALFDLITGSHSDTVSTTMTYQSDVDMWTVDLTDFTTFIDRHKYVGRVVATDASNMRVFKINEFSIDNDAFEDTWMNLPYQIEIGEGYAYIRWYDSEANFGDLDYCKFQAFAYEGGSGVTPATDVSRITHRGAIATYSGGAG